MIQPRARTARCRREAVVTPMLAWGLVLLAAALLLVVIEIFIPSAGLISIVAGLIGIAGIVCLFQESAGWGLAGAATALFLVPIIFYFGFKLMPSTPFGKKLLYGESGRHEPVIPEDHGSELEALLGAEGEAVSD